MTLESSTRMYFYFEVIFVWWTNLQEQRGFRQPVLTLTTLIAAAGGSEPAVSFGLMLFTQTYWFFQSILPFPFPVLGSSPASFITFRCHVFFFSHPWNVWLPVHDSGTWNFWWVLVNYFVDCLSVWVCLKFSSHWLLIMFLAGISG